MSKLVSQFLSRLISAYVKRISDASFVELILFLVKDHVRDQVPAEALKTLFTLDAHLYAEQGLLAVAYDGGIHTKHRHMKYHDFFTSRIDEDDRVIDIGCGIGAVAYDVSKVATQVVGIDLNVKSINTARARYQNPNLTFRTGDALATLPDENFSVVLLSNVLEHLQNRPQFLRHLQDTLQPHRILIRVPLYERDWRVPLKKELGVEWRLDPTHETEYTLETFADEIRAANLRIDYLEVRWGEIWSEVSSNL
jgi:2-polyprenyl-3-methyl-5-hydroxy-6-metoxy-1,4-benzoquinol methylase